MFLKPRDPRVDEALMLSLECDDHYIACSGESIGKHGNKCSVDGV